MKKIQLLMLLFIVSNNSIAQSPFGIEGGLNVSQVSYTLTTSGHTDVAPTTARTGIRLGGVWEARLSRRWSLEPGLMYLMNGFGFKDGAYNYHLNINTFEIPLNVKFSFGRAGGTRFFVGSGFYYANNFSGKETRDAGGPTLESVSMRFGSSENDNYKRGDFGINFSTGVIFRNGLNIKMSDQVGFVNLLPSPLPGENLTSTNFGLTVGYFFSGKKQTMPKGHTRQKNVKRSKSNDLD